MKTLLIASLAAAAAACGRHQVEASPTRGDARPVAAARFLADGTLQRPRGYRTWVYVGAPLTPNDMNAGKAAFPEFHSVYVDPDSYRAYQRTGRWRDGTVLVKELISVGSKAATSGNGYFMGDFVGVEAAVKSAERFPDQPGNWGYFRFTDEDGGPPRRTAELMPTAACAACHAAAAREDLVFTQYYPVLRAVRGHENGAPEDS